MYLIRLFVCVVVLLSSVATAMSQPAASAVAPSGTANVATATRAPEAPTLDGDVIGDPAWAQATPITTFWQEQPNEGQPASERTEVRIIFTADTLYIGAVMYDSDPSGIIVSDARRDSALDDSDSFQMIVDTYRDRQNGFVFGTNPAGIEYDGQVTNEGQGGGGLGQGQRQSGGSGSGFNINWDAAWTVRSKISEHGWSAEFAIPFRTLRYPASTSQTWGVNFQRNIRRKNERAYWAPIPRQFNLYRLSLAGAITGVQTPALRNLRVTPYALGNVLESGITPVDSETDFDFGGDLKYSITPSLTLDATVNTDFAQVEVDDQQVNLDRFTLFFPEKRPFFLENAGFFSVGNPGEVDLFFSRRIGIGDSGAVDSDRRRRPRLGQGRQVQRRPAEHADVRLRRHPSRRQLQRRAGQPRPAESLVDRRDRHQSPGHRRPGRRQRLRPHLRPRRQARHRHDLGRDRVRGQDRHARRRHRRLRLQPALADQSAAVGFQRRLPGSRRRLQPGESASSAAAAIASRTSS